MNSSVTIGHSNVHSVVCETRVKELEKFLCRNSVDIFGVQESWLRDDETTMLGFQIDNILVEEAHCDMHGKVEFLNSNT